jgi:hypothetical protein
LESPQERDHLEYEGGNMGSEWILRRLAWCVLHSTGSGMGPMVDCCECGDESSGSWATELVSWVEVRNVSWVQTPSSLQYFYALIFYIRRCLAECWVSTAVPGKGGDHTSGDELPPGFQLPYLHFMFLLTADFVFIPRVVDC